LLEDEREELTGVVSVLDEQNANTVEGAADIAADGVDGHARIL
jgi:hypothetical protein